MKPLTLTGISQETPLDDPESTFIHLVFNHGEVRVPTNEDGVQAILDHMAGTAAAPQEPVVPTMPAGVEVFGGDEPEPEASQAAWLAQQDEEDSDDDYEVNDGVGSI